MKKVQNHTAHSTHLFNVSLISCKQHCFRGKGNVGAKCLKNYDEFCDFNRPGLYLFKELSHKMEQALITFMVPMRSAEFCEVHVSIITYQALVIWRSDDFSYYVVTITVSIFTRGQVDESLKTSMKTFCSKHKYQYWGQVRIAIVLCRLWHYLLLICLDFVCSFYNSIASSFI